MAFPSRSSSEMEQKEDDKQSEMMDGRGMIFQSICHPQFRSRAREAGLMSCLIQAGLCHCAGVCDRVFKRASGAPASTSLSCEVGVYSGARWRFLSLCVRGVQKCFAEVKQTNCHHLVPGNTR